jgi:DNA polymerase-3 subunit epsilon
MSKKILWLDCETTGLSERSTIVQLSGIIDINGVKKEEFNIYARPDEFAEISPEALEIIQLTEEQIMKFPPRMESVRKFKKTMGFYINKFDKSDKFILAGQNVSFDLGQLIRWCEDKYLGSYINFRGTLDTLHLFRALQIAGKFPPTKNCKLETLAELFGYELIAHDALNDIRVTRAIGIDMMNMLQDVKLFERRAK